MAEIHEEARQVTMSFNEMIMIQLRDLKESQRELKADIKDVRQEIKDIRQELQETRKEINARIDKQEAKIEENRKELSGKIDALHSELKSSTGHISIANISTVGIALAVIYAVLK